MKISGLQKLSLVDFDGHMSATIFVPHCNFNCPFCHNSGLVKGLEEIIPEKEIIEYLTKRKGLLDSVVISGGEPTIYPDLIEFISKIKEMGYLVKLDSNGTNPEMLKKLVENSLIDYIAMDIKNSLAKYPITADADIDTKNITESIHYIMNSGIDYEFRTTLVNEFHTSEDMKDIGKLIKNAKKYFLQKFEDSGHCIRENLHEVSKADANKFLKVVQNYIPNTKLRGY